MKKDFRYLILLAGTVLLFILVEMLIPRPVNWSITYSTRDKNPFGTYVVDSMLHQIFPGQSITNNNQTLNEIFKETKASTNIFILTNNFYPDSSTTHRLLEQVASGRQIFIGTQQTGGLLSDTLNLEIEQAFQKMVRRSLPTANNRDSISLNFTREKLQKEGGYKYHPRDAGYYFSKFDTLKASVIATNKESQPVLIQYSKKEEGKLIISCTPLAFTNYYLLWQQNHEFISRALSYLQVRDLIWTEYYQLGRMEPQTPLRFILGNPSLKWALYISLAGLVLFILFEAKRKQSVIPLTKPKINSTLEFINTITHLYLKESDHKNIASKKISYFRDFIFHNYRIAYEDIGSKEKERLAKKTGLTPDQIFYSFRLIDNIDKKARVTSNQLIELEKQLHEFYYPEQSVSRNSQAID